MASSTIQLELNAGWWTRFGLRQARCLLTSHLLARSQHPSVIAGIQAGSVGKCNPAVCHSFRPRKTRRNFFIISEYLRGFRTCQCDLQIITYPQCPLSQTVVTVASAAVRSLTSSRVVLLPGVRGLSVSVSRFAIAWILYQHHPASLIIHWLN